MKHVTGLYLGEGTVTAAIDEHFEVAGIRPGDTVAILSAERHAALEAAAKEGERLIELHFKRRGWTTGKKLWERRLLHLCKLALGKESPFKPSDLTEKTWI